MDEWILGDHVTNCLSAIMMFRLNVHHPINLKKFDIFTPEENIKYKQNSSNCHSEDAIQKRTTSENLGQQESVSIKSDYICYCDKINESYNGVHINRGHCKDILVSYTYNNACRTNSEPGNKQWTNCKLVKLNTAQRHHINREAGHVEGRRGLLYKPGTYSQSHIHKYREHICRHVPGSDEETDDEVFIEEDISQSSTHQKCPHISCHVSSICLPCLV
jgi:hypothetical protein